jgi:hypothetical protein
MNRSTFWVTILGAGVASAVAYHFIRQQIEFAEACARDEERLNETLDDSFPASDPPSFTPAAASTARR